jgi:hypothetical protein
MRRLLILAVIVAVAVVPAGGAALAVAKHGSLDEGKGLLSQTMVTPWQAVARARRPAHFVHGVDNPWLPFRPGMKWVYRGVKDGKTSRDVVTVISRTRLIDGVRCVAVDDRLYLRDALEERTTDWYAQDARGNVWYFGEETAELDAAGHVTSREGSWRAGVDGAKAGIVMPARPRVGQSFRQEFYKGHAEDHFRALSLSATVHVPYTSSRHALLTKEWTPLEPGVIAHKLYVRGIGMVKEETIKGGDERGELVSFKRG